jgi:hypothetical protein
MEISQETMDEFELSATRTPKNLRSWVEVVIVFSAMGVDELTAIDSAGNIVFLLPVGPARGKHRSGRVH